jgi:precorrin-6B methylase 2
MKTIIATEDNIVGLISQIPTWMTDDEKVELFKLGKNVKPGELILEIGALYGGSTAILGLASKKAELVVIDNFSWSPLDTMPASAEQLRKNLLTVGLKDVVIHEMDSIQASYSEYDPSIALLWIDGGHSLEFISHDLATFGPHARVIACHDFDNPAWPTIRQAVEQFIAEHPEWHIDHVVSQICVLKRFEHAAKS